VPKKRRSRSTQHYSLPQALSLLIYRRPDPESDFAPFDVINAAVRIGDRELTERALAVRDELQNRLESGKVVAFGVRIGSSEHIQIPAIEWRRIDSLKLFDPAIPPTAVSANGDAASRWFDVVVREEDLRTLRRRRPLSRRRLDDARAAIQEAYSAKGSQLTEAELAALRKDRFPWLPRDQLRQLAIEVQGARRRGRPTKVNNLRK
jgi:hypothetical protein